MCHILCVTGAIVLTQPQLQFQLQSAMLWVRIICNFLLYDTQPLVIKITFLGLFTMFQNSKKIGAWSGDDGMDSWCTTNCNHPIPYCPPTQVMVLIVTMRILMLVKCQMKKPA